MLSPLKKVLFQKQIVFIGAGKVPNLSAIDRWVPTLSQIVPEHPSYVQKLAIA